MNRTAATHLFNLPEALQELDNLKFAVWSIVQQFPVGGYERELCSNAAKGIADRLDYLHDSFLYLDKQKATP